MSFLLNKPLLIPPMELLICLNLFCTQRLFLVVLDVKYCHSSDMVGCRTFGEPQMYKDARIRP